MALIVVGLGITFGFLGFLAYLIAQGKQACPEPTPTPTYVPVYTQIPQKEEKVVETEEIRPTRPHIVNHTLNNANQWYAIPIPKDIKTWSMNARGEYDLLYAFEPSHATYRTLFSGMFLDSDTAPNNISEIYVSSDTAGAVVELMLYR